MGPASKFWYLNIIGVPHIALNSVAMNHFYIDLIDRLVSLVYVKSQGKTFKEIPNKDN